MVSGTDRLGGSRLAGLGGGGGSNGRAGGREVFVMEESLGDGGEGVQVAGRLTVCGVCVCRCAGLYHRSWMGVLGARLGKF